MQRRIGNSGKGLEMNARAGQLAALVALGSFALLAPMAAQIITACLTEGEAGPYAARLDPMRFV